MNRPPTYAYVKLCMSARVNIHVEQCRDYAWPQERIKDVIRAISTYYSLNCSFDVLLLKKKVYVKKGNHLVSVQHLHRPD